MQVKRFRAKIINYICIGVVLGACGGISVNVFAQGYEMNRTLSVGVSISLDSSSIKDIINVDGGKVTVTPPKNNNSNSVVKPNGEVDVDKVLDLMKEQEALAEQKKQEVPKVAGAGVGTDHRTGKADNPNADLHLRSNFLEMRQGMESLFNTRVTSTGGSGTLYTTNYFNSIREVYHPSYRGALIQDCDFDIKPYTAELKTLASKSFNDITGKEWYADKIPSAVYYNLVGGYSDGTFRGNQAVTRAEFANLMGNYENETYPVYAQVHPQFADKWYSKNVSILNTGAIGLSGLSEKWVNQGMTRGEIANLIAQKYFMGDYQRALAKVEAKEYNTNIFTDIKQVSETYIIGVSNREGGDAAIAKYNEMCKNASVVPSDIMAGLMVMKDKNLINGDDQGRSNWNKPVTRAEAIVIFNNLSQIH